MTSAALIVLINLFTSFAKRYIMPTFGAAGVHVLVFVLSVFAALYVSYGKGVPAIKETIENAGVIFCLAVTFYEVALRYIPMFKQEGSSFVG